nr:ribosome small subunit-dependent GTPase A [Collinsella urealyticum]
MRAPSGAASGVTSGVGEALAADVAGESGTMSPGSSEVEALRDVPTLADIRIDDQQMASFEEFRATFAASAGEAAAERLTLGCVVRLDRGFPLVAHQGGVLRAEHAVAFAKRDRGCGDALPAIGDIVAVRIDPAHDFGVIEAVMPRRTSFARWRGKNRGERQVLAANVDRILVVQPLGGGRQTGSFLRDRIARALVLVHDCGAEPAVVFTKSDRASDDEIADALRVAQALAGSEARVLVSSATEREGLAEIRALVPPHTCAMILGESGAGKSTLLNALLGHDALTVGAVRERDDKGRHTTVARVMCKLPGAYGVIADAPGLRSMTLLGHEAGLARAFPDIAQVAEACRFRDCTHTHEPGCAVRAAGASGEIDPIRIEAALALASEMRVSAQSLDPDVRL